MEIISNICAKIYGCRITKASIFLDSQQEFSVIQLPKNSQIRLKSCSEAHTIDVIHAVTAYASTIQMYVIRIICSRLRRRPVPTRQTLT